MTTKKIICMVAYLIDDVHIDTILIVMTIVIICTGLPWVGFYGRGTTLYIFYSFANVL